MIFRLVPIQHETQKMMHSRIRSNPEQNNSTKSPIRHFHSIQQQFTLVRTIFLATIIILIFGSKVEGRVRRESNLPLSMDKEMLPVSWTKIVGSGGLRM